MASHSPSKSTTTLGMQDTSPDCARSVGIVNKNAANSVMAGIKILMIFQFVSYSKRGERSFLGAHLMAVSNIMKIVISTN